MGRLARLLRCLISLVAPAALISAGCSNATVGTEKAVTPLDAPKPPARGFFMGLLPTPGQAQSFADAYRQASAYADFAPVWGRPTPFYNLARDLNGKWGRTFVTQYIRGNGMFPLIHMSFLGPDLTLVAPPGMSGATLENREWRQAYKQAAIDIVRNCRPLYFSVGNEVNRWYEKYGARAGDPNGFQHYVSLYSEIYDALKQLSPQTKVFCTFAREIVSENREADLSVLTLFDRGKMDILVMTSYPFAVREITLTSDIPDNYYSRAVAHMPHKPFGLSEIGWSALPAFGGEQGQAHCLELVTGRLTVDQGITLELLAWPWLYALDRDDSVALIKNDGVERLAFAVWQRLFTKER